MACVGEVCCGHEVVVVFTFSSFKEKALGNQVCNMVLSVSGPSVKTHDQRFQWGLVGQMGIELLQDYICCYVLTKQITGEVSSQFCNEKFMFSEVLFKWWRRDVVLILCRSFGIQ